MESLVLKAGGVLERTTWVYDKEAKKGAYETKDVSHVAPQFLMEPVALAEDLRMRDVFSLVQLHPLIATLLSRDWAAEYLNAAANRPIKPYEAQYSPGGMEYLELYQCWEKDSTTGKLEGTSRLSFHGVGFLLQEDVLQDDWVAHKKGTRIQWAIEFTPIEELLDLPLRYNPEVPVYECGSGRTYGNKLEVLRPENPTLLQVIHGIFWEISFNGGPEDSAEAAEKLIALGAEVKEVLEAEGPDSPRFTTSVV